MIENCKLKSHPGLIEWWGKSSRETSHKRLLSEKTADGPCAQACFWERFHEDLGRSWKGTVQESWGKGLRGLDCPVLLGGMSKDGVKPLGLAAERPRRQQRRVCVLPWALQLCRGGSRVGGGVAGWEGRAFQKVSHPISNPNSRRKGKQG